MNITRFYKTKWSY